MNKMKKILIWTVPIAIIGVAGVLYLNGWFKLGSSGLPTSPAKTGSALYTNDAYRFSLKYPAALATSTFSTPDGTGDIVLIDDNKTGLGMQISITPFDENITALTVDRIKQDVPDLTILESQDVLLGSSGKGVAFLDGTSTSANRQVWFIAGQHLYQITAPVAFDQQLKDVLNSWVFY